MKLSQDFYEARELQWKLYTKAGNHRMQENLYLEAQQAYNQALELAHLLLEEAKSSNSHSDAIHPYVISCHNLADSWLNLENVQQAEMVLQQAFHQVIQVMNNGGLPESLRLEAFKALRAVSFEMDRFYRKLNQVAQAEEAFERATILAQDFLAQFDFSQTVSLEDLRRNN